jgi:hypothetical protein
MLQYVRKTADHGLMFDSGELKLEVYYAADPDKRRSTGNYVFLLAGGAVSMGSKLMPTVAMSTLDTE